MPNSPFENRTLRQHPWGSKRPLGELESKVMHGLWEKPGSSVKEIWEALSRHRALAYTTVMTTMDRLYHKGLLQRSKLGKAFFYTPTYTRQEFEEMAAEEALRGLASATSEAFLFAFLDLLSERDPASLDRLEAIIRQRREGDE